MAKTSKQGEKAGSMEQGASKMESRLMYEARLKPGHPTGVYRRAGGIFYTTGGTFLEEVPPEIANDPWIIVSPDPVEIAWDPADEVPAP